MVKKKVVELEGFVDWRRVRAAFQAALAPSPGARTAVRIAPEAASVSAGTVMRRCSDAPTPELGSFLPLGRSSLCWILARLPNQNSKIISEFSFILSI